MLAQGRRIVPAEGSQSGRSSSSKSSSSFCAVSWEVKRSICSCKCCCCWLACCREALDLALMVLLMSCSTPLRLESKACNSVGNMLAPLSLRQTYIGVSHRPKPTPLSGRTKRDIQGKVGETDALIAKTDCECYYDVKPPLNNFRDQNKSSSVKWEHMTLRPPFLLYQCFFILAMVQHDPSSQSRRGHPSSSCSKLGVQTQWTPSSSVCPCGGNEGRLSNNHLHLALDLRDAAAWEHATEICPPAWSFWGVRPSWAGSWSQDVGGATQSCPQLLRNVELQDPKERGHGRLRRFCECMRSTWEAVVLR